MKAHQKIIREKKALEDTNDIFGNWWKDVDVDIKKAEIKEVKYSIANQIIEEYEWLKCMPAMVKHCYGIFFEGNCGGVVVYSDEYSENLGHWDKYDYTGKMILLSRGACVHWSHKHSASKLICQSIKMLPDKYKIVTATVDELAGEIGTIYQACNFIYIGSMRENNPNIKNPKGSRFGVIIKDKLYGSRAMRQKVGSQKKADILKLFPDAKFVKQKAKSRYFYFRGTKKEKRYYRKQIEEFIKPYPKRNEIYKSN
jgi:hypothetical protein